ncbi:hypothetical protein [Cohaesibacter intestini]|uniref:hypothetical protein n=1 Tax=Cohaesibacter intestini TaxID=2211145 RepID=UPI000DE81000|nr:hypothetical protein [Cohaesibacter intestini]
MMMMAHAAESTTSTLLESSRGSLWDLLPVALIVAVALFYLYRKLWAKRGACSDCTSGGPTCSACVPGEIEFDTKTPLKRPVGKTDA